MRQLVYQVCFTRYHVLFYLLFIGSVLKHCKFPKYYEHDCIPFNTASLVGFAFGAQSEGGLWWSFSTEAFNVLRPLAAFAEDLPCWCLAEFWMRLCLRRFHHRDYRENSITPRCLLIFLIHTNTKTTIWNLGLTPRPKNGFPNHEN